MRKLSPSMLSANFAELKNDIIKVENAGAKYLHIDVMDGVFVPNISFGAPVYKKLRGHSNMVFDVHLMIIEPERYIEDFVKAGADIVNFHIEATKKPEDVIRKIKSLGAKAGVTVKPKTDVYTLLPVLPMVDLVLVMTVEPGFGGQKLMVNCLEKIKKLVELRREMGLDFEIEIDGGVNLSNLNDVLKAGTDVVVAGSAVFDAEDIECTAREFVNMIEGFEQL